MYITIDSISGIRLHSLLSGQNWKPTSSRLLLTDLLFFFLLILPTRHQKYTTVLRLVDEVLQLPLVFRDGADFLYIHAVAQLLDVGDGVFKGSALSNPWAGCQPNHLPHPV